LSYRVEIRVESEGHPPPDLARLKRLVRWALAQEGVPAAEVGVLLTTDAGIQQLNREYLQRDEPTDVIAFSLGETEGLPEGELPYLGDVAISLDRAREQAAEVGHPWCREVELLVVHGLLHLLGYEDEGESERRRMVARQDELLRAFEHRRPLWASFQAAFSGLGNLFRTQRNARIHLGAALAAVVLGGLLRLAFWEWAVLVLTIAVVLVAEGLNSAIEALVDLASPESRPLARRAKDLAAAAVLLAACLAVVVGAVLFLPHLLAWLK
jgi:diacylglycerol kinase (ATP)